MFCVTDTLKTFFNNKRRTYRAEKKKLESSKSGQASSDSYKGKWKFFHCLNFLDAAKPTGTRTFSEAFEVAEPEAVNFVAALYMPFQKSLRYTAICCVDSCFERLSPFAG